MSAIRSVVCILFVSLVIIGSYGCRRTTYDYGCPTDPNASYFYLAVTAHDTQSVFTDATNVPQVYYYKNGNKDFISDISLVTFGTAYKYKYVVSSVTLEKTSIDSGVNNFYLQQTSGIIDSFTASATVNRECIDAYGLSSVTAINGVSFYDTTASPIIWVFRQN